MRDATEPQLTTRAPPPLCQARFATTAGSFPWRDAGALRRSPPAALALQFDSGDPPKTHIVSSFRLFDVNRRSAQRACEICPAVEGRCGLGAAYGNVSGNTRMPVVSTKACFPSPGNVSSIKNAVHPLSAAVTFATHVFGPVGVNGVLVYALPILSCRKLRASGFFACH